MASPNALHIYEEIMLLALRDQEGTVANGYAQYAVAAAVLAELLLDKRIAIDTTKKKLIDLLNAAPSGDAVIDECLEKMQTSSRRASLSTWVSKFACIKRLRHKAAQQLCNRGILRADERRILLIFTQKIFPEINPAPERMVIERLRAAIFADGNLDARTAVLISIANSTQILATIFGRKQIRQRRKRIKEIVSGDAVGKATKEVIEAVEMAILVAAIMPALAAATG